MSGSFHFRFSSLDGGLVGPSVLLVPLPPRRWRFPRRVLGAAAAAQTTCDGGLVGPSVLLAPLPPRRWRFPRRVLGAAAAAQTTCDGGLVCLSVLLPPGPLRRRRFSRHAQTTLWPSLTATITRRESSDVPGWRPRPRLMSMVLTPAQHDFPSHPRRR